MIFVPFTLAIVGPQYALDAGVPYVPPARRGDYDDRDYDSRDYDT